MGDTMDNRQLNTLNNLEAQKYLKKSHILLNVFLWAAIIGVLDFATMIVILLFFLNSVNPIVLLVLLIIAAVCSVICLFCNSKAKGFKRNALVAEGLYDSVDDVIKAEEQKRKEQDNIIEARRAVTRPEKEKREVEINAAQHPQCPACHGYNTQRISTTKRVVSTSLIGLASSTIGKQYECIDCRHKW